MPVEIEAKMKVEDFEALREKLRAVGATLVGSVLETNTFFDTPDRKLTARDEGLRLRANRKPDGDERHVITFKGPKQNGPLKIREEQELTVSSASDAAKLLDHLGFKPMISFEKRRETWRQNSCTIELDEVPHLGKFVEIEGPNEAAIERLRADLNLSQLPIIHRSYIGLLVAFLRERGNSCTSIRFQETT